MEKKYKELTDEMFREMMKSDKGIREARYAIGYGRWVDGKSVTDGHRVQWNWADYDISDEQMSEARERFDRRKAEVFAAVTRPGVLCFHAMGMDYEPTCDGGIGNYRIRSTFKDKTGHVWFVEVHPLYGKNQKGDDKLGFYGEVYDASRNDAEMKQYNEAYDRLMAEYGAWWKIPTNLRPHMPFAHYERVESNAWFTYWHLLKWVNLKFCTDYKELVLERYFLECDDTISEC